jgi:Na+-driven multidrug efflux pump
VEEFGLFFLLIQIAAYFALFEIGMSAATARILVDHKDHRDGGAYGSVILTGFWVFVIQGVIILAVGILAAPWIISVVGVPSGLAEVATLLLRWLLFTSALTLAFRIYGSVLYANKRLDLIHGFMGANIIFGLALLAVSEAFLVARKRSNHPIRRNSTEPIVVHIGDDQRFAIGQKSNSARPIKRGL